MKYYAIKGDDYKNIVLSWDEAKKIISEVSHPKYKSFSTEEEAKAFLEDVSVDDNVLEPKCYIDGSFNEREVSAFLRKETILIATSLTSFALSFM